jgi:signal transduction histidine kinase
MVNLLSNAIKFTPPQGQITVSCSAGDKTVAIHVADTGLGIPADKVDAIFDPFVQIKDHLQVPEAGIGLGLAISRGLARGMHGELTVDSTVGVGTRFTLELPSS